MAIADVSRRTLVKATGAIGASMLPVAIPADPATAQEDQEHSPYYPDLARAREKSLDNFAFWSGLETSLRSAEYVVLTRFLPIMEASYARARARRDGAWRRSFAIVDDRDVPIQSHDAAWSRDWFREGGLSEPISSSKHCPFVILPVQRNTGTSGTRCWRLIGSRDSGAIDRG